MNNLQMVKQRSIMCNNRKLFNEIQTNIETLIKIYSVEYIKSWLLSILNT